MSKEVNRAGLEDKGADLPEVVTDHSVPYPEAPEVNHGDAKQEHYRGARDPEQDPKNQRRFHD